MSFSSSNSLVRSVNSLGRALETLLGEGSSAKVPRFPAGKKAGWEGGSGLGGGRDQMRLEEGAWEGSKLEAKWGGTSAPRRAREVPQKGSEAQVPAKRDVYVGGWVVHLWFVAY